MAEWRYESLLALPPYRPTALPPDRLDLECHIARPHTMRERSDRHEVRAGLCVSPHIVERDAASGLDLDAGSERAGAGRPLGERRRRLVVDEEACRAGGTRELELNVGLDFDLKSDDAAGSRIGKRIGERPA